MSFGWKDVGRLVAKSAPVLASALGGPVGAIAGAAGAILGSALGVEPTPDNVAKALQSNDPQIAVKLAEIESNHSVALASLASQQAIEEAKANATVAVAQETTEQVRFTTQVNESDIYTKRTRPTLARQSGYLAFAYAGVHMLSLVGHAVAPTHVSEISFSVEVFLGIGSIALTYCGVRSIDMWRSGGAKRV